MIIYFYDTNNITKNIYINACVIELHALYECLEIARDRVYFRVELNVDSKIIVDT
jgi:ribonuclease HI